MLWTHALWQRDKQRPATGLFSAARTGRRDIPDLPLDSPGELKRREMDVLGLLVDGHPICLYADKIAPLKTVKARDLVHFVGRKIRFAGWLITGKTVKTKQGDPMNFLTFEDETGIVETVFFPKPFARFCHIIGYGKPFLLSGRVASDWGAVTLIVTATRPIG